MAIGLKVRKYVNTSKSETTSVTVQTPESKSIFIQIWWMRQNLQTKQNKYMQK